MNKEVKMEPIYLSISQKETGRHIKQLLKENEYSVKDIQCAMGFENPQAIYKWISGKALPSLDNILILSRLLHTNIEDILVIDGDVVFIIMSNLRNSYYLLIKHYFFCIDIPIVMVMSKKPFFKFTVLTDLFKIISLPVRLVQSTS
jgi:transcriptional regulator with XRE-family HTH domain